jgi:ribonuclease P protein component
MITRYHRFHGYGSFRLVFGRGQTVRAPLLSLKYFSRDPTRNYRAAVIVSRKVSKSAVVRNRIRRRVYEVIRRQENSIPGGLDLVFTVFGDDLATMNAKKLDVTVSDLIQKAIQATLNANRGTSEVHGIVKSKGK